MVEIKGCYWQLCMRCRSTDNELLMQKLSVRCSGTMDEMSPNG